MNCVKQKKDNKIAVTDQKSVDKERQGFGVPASLFVNVSMFIGFCGSSFALLVPALKLFFYL